MRVRRYNEHDLLPKDYDAPQQLRSEGWGNCPVPTCGLFL